MNLSKPLRAGLFFYECARFILLLVLLLAMPQGGTVNRIAIYLSANALFPLMILFVWVNPREYRPYLSLYMAGKLIVLVSFFAWELFSAGNFSGFNAIMRNMVYVAASLILCLADILSVWGAWTIKNNIPGSPDPEAGGI
ncbi:MAG: hypothetical protein FWH12_01510 [Treponema sp.]|nr:hypothetical protein [Treponema sp.]